MAKPLEVTMHDFNDVQIVEFKVSRDKKRIWLNVDGVCVARVQGVNQIDIVKD